jgi:DNA-binding MarR family transcriptional regulator
VHPDDSPSWSTSRQETNINDGSSAMDQAVLNLRSLILAGEHYRQVLAEAIGLGTTESQALSYLAVHGSSGQSELARDLGLTSSALTALVDRLERQGVAERVRHPRDRRRTIVSLTERGRSMVVESHRWLAATLERIDPRDLELVSASLSVIAADLATRTSGDRVDDWADATHALPA